jgi:hypothetical protein
MVENPHADGRGPRRRFVSPLQHRRSPLALDVRWLRTQSRERRLRLGDLRSAGDSAVCVGMLFSAYADLLTCRVSIRVAGDALVGLGNRFAEALATRIPSRETAPGAVFANYHIVAEP